MKWVFFAVLPLVVACGRKEPIPQPEEAPASVATESSGPVALSTDLRPARAGDGGLRTRFSGTLKLAPGVARTLRAASATTPQASEKSP